MTEIATNEPLKFRAGDTVEWKRSFSDYPAPTWILTYVLVKADKQIKITASADGSDHLVSVAKAASAAYPAGKYHWHGYVDDGTERVSIGTGSIEILANFDALETGHDARTLAEKMVDAFEDHFQSKIARDDLDRISSSLANRSITKMSLAELRVEYHQWKEERRREIDSERISKGLGTGRKIKTRFV